MSTPCKPARNVVPGYSVAWAASVNQFANVTSAIYTRKTNYRTSAFRVRAIPASVCKLESVVDVAVHGRHNKILIKPNLSVNKSEPKKGLRLLIDPVDWFAEEALMTKTNLTWSNVTVRSILETVCWNYSQKEIACARETKMQSVRILSLAVSLSFSLIYR